MKTKEEELNKAKSKLMDECRGSSAQMLIAEKFTYNNGFSDGWDARQMSQIQCLADIREAVGDPEGKLMQDELVKRIRELVEDREILSQRVKRLAKHICKGLEDEEQ